MRKKGIALLAALLLALLAGCGANGAAQPEQIDEPAVDPNLSPTAAFMAALQEDEVTKRLPFAAASWPPQARSRCGRR